MTRDPSRYHNPLSFNPGRFLPSDGTEPEYDPREIVFGFGRRSVPPIDSILSCLLDTDAENRTHLGFAQVHILFHPSCFAIAET